MNILTLKEITEAQEIINASKKGTYELKEVYCKNWELIENKIMFGKRFKATVEAELLSNIKILKPKSNNHQTYEISKA